MEKFVCLFVDDGNDNIVIDKATVTIEDIGADMEADNIPSKIFPHTPFPVPSDKVLQDISEFVSNSGINDERQQSKENVIVSVDKDKVYDDDIDNDRFSEVAIS